MGFWCFKLLGILHSRLHLPVSSDFNDYFGHLAICWSKASCEKRNDADWPGSALDEKRTMHLCHSFHLLRTFVHWQIRREHIRLLWRWSNRIRLCLKAYNARSLFAWRGEHGSADDVSFCQFQTRQFAPVVSEVRPVLRLNQHGLVWYYLWKRWHHQFGWKQQIEFGMWFNEICW